MNTHPWTEEQQARLRSCIKRGDTIAYWNSDAHGRPANGGTHDGWTAAPGLIQQVDPNAFRPCGPGALHATDEPHRWAGCRVWVVAMRGRVERQSGKIAATVREILGEVLPEHAWSPSVGVRLGRKDLRGAYLYGANLGGADLHGADLRGADLSRADLGGADLHGADLHGANLSDAHLHGAYLHGAYLYGANLSDAHLHGAHLHGADLRGANLGGANLHGADLDGADLGNWERGPDGYARPSARSM